MSSLGTTPDLRTLAEQYGVKLAILSIMADEKREDTAEAVESGKQIWHVCWDGYRGRIATKWAVQSFPTVYIVGSDGRMATRDLYLRGELLKAKIVDLTR